MSFVSFVGETLAAIEMVGSLGLFLSPILMGSIVTALVGPYFIGLWLIKPYL